MKAITILTQMIMLEDINNLIGLAGKDKEGLKIFNKVSLECDTVAEIGNRLLTLFNKDIVDKYFEAIKKKEGK